MKKLLLLVLLLNTLGSCSGQDTNNVPDKKTISTIKKAEKVVYYALDPMSSDTTKPQIAGVPITIFSKELRQAEKDSLTHIIIDNVKNVQGDGKGKFCPPAPQDAFLFIKGNDTVQFVVDLNCASYTIVKDTLEFEYDIEKIYDKMSPLVKSIRGNVSQLINQSSDTSKNMLPDQMKRIISEADSVVCYLLDPLDKNFKDTLNGFCILDYTNVDAKLVDSLKNILLDDSNFGYPTFLKNCTFLCDITFRMYAKGEYADVMFAFYCDDCVVFCGNEHIKSDSRNMRKGILEIAKYIFPKDRYVRHLLNQ